jgi:predicted GTPase
MPIKTLIMGAAGRDFHNFNTVYRDDAASEVVAFTAAQIPDIAGRRYPASLAGPRYPRGIPILDEAELADLVARERVDEVVFAYSDVSHETVMHCGSTALAAGADFVLLGPKRTMLRARVPVIAVSAVRTGCGKSQVARWLAALLAELGIRVVVLRHPMPYGDLARQTVQRFASRADLDAERCTVEEREEYEPHLARGTVVYAGVDYAAILARAEDEADVLLWDGGNNDFPFLVPDLHVVLVDPLRAGDELRHHPGETVLRMADVVVAAKSDVAAPRAVELVLANARAVNPRAAQYRGGSPVRLEDPGAVHGRRVLVVEDGPTLTHGGMGYGAGFVAAVRAGAELVDPRASAAPGIAALYAAHPALGPVLPAAGYDAAQREALRRTIEDSAAELVVAGTPIDLAAVLGLTKPVLRVHYELEDLDRPGLGVLVDEFVAARRPRRA